MLRSFWVEEIKWVVGETELGALGQGIEDMATGYNLAGALLADFLGFPSLKPNRLTELIRCVSAPEVLLHNHEDDVQRFHLIAFAILYLLGIANPKMAESACKDYFFTVPNEVKYSAKAFGALVRRKQGGNEAQTIANVLCAPLSKCGLDLFTSSPSFELDHVLQLKRQSVGISGNLYLQLAFALRLDLFVETEEQALLLPVLGKELGLAPKHLLLLIHHDRNPKFRSAMFQNVQQVPLLGSEFQSHVAAGRFVEASKRAKTEDERVVLDLYNSTLNQQVYFDAQQYSEVALLMHNSRRERAEADREEEVLPTATSAPAAAMPAQLLVPKFAPPANNSSSNELAQQASSSQSLARTLAEKMKSKNIASLQQPAIPPTTTTVKSVTTSSSTAAQLKDKLRPRN